MHVYVPGDEASKLWPPVSNLSIYCETQTWRSWLRKLASEQEKKCPSHSIKSNPQLDLLTEVLKSSKNRRSKPPCLNNNQTERDAAASDTIPKSAKGNNIAAQDEMDLDHSYTMIVKATYKDDTVKFPLGSNSGIEELRRELCKRFEFKAERFQIMSCDEGDWILVSCDEDFQLPCDM